MTRFIIALLSLWALPLYADISVDKAWIRAAPPNAPAMAAFMTLQNNGEQDVKLLSAHVAGFGRVELHRTMDVDGMMKMVKQDFMPVPANGALELKPGSWHIMLIQPEKVPQVNEKIELTLTFDDDSSTKVSVTVKEAPIPQHMHP